MNDTHGVTGQGWYGFDLDGTLAVYDKWRGIDHIGEPVKPMVALIKKMHAEGKIVKILTARVAPRPDSETATTRYPLYVGEDIGDVPEYAARWMNEMREAGHLNDQVEACKFYFKKEWDAHDFIADWCLEHLGFLPEITHEKDHRMIELYDDRVKQVIPNEGLLVEDLYSELGKVAKNMYSELGWAKAKIESRFTGIQTGMMIATLIYLIFVLILIPFGGKIFKSKTDNPNKARVEQLRDAAEDLLDNWDEPKK